MNDSNKNQNFKKTISRINHFYFRALVIFIVSMALAFRLGLNELSALKKNLAWAGVLLLSFVASKLMELLSNGSDETKVPITLKTVYRASGLFLILGGLTYSRAKEMTGEDQGYFLIIIYVFSMIASRLFELFRGEKRQT